MTFGIIGTNFISDAFVAALPLASSRATAVYSRTWETGAAFAHKHEIAHVFDDMEAFLSSDLFDAVYVASPNFLHEAQSIDALKHGKHVLCEKPIAPSLDGFLRMQAVAKREGRVLMEAMRPHHDTLLRAVKARILPQIGHVHTATLSFCQYSSRYDKFLAGTYTNTFDPALSNAALLDIGIYPVAAAAMLFGEPQSVQAESVFLPGGFEGEGCLRLTYEDAFVTVNYSKIRDDKSPSTLLGERGALLIDKISQPARLAYHFHTEEEHIITRACGTYGNMFEEVLDFIDAIASGELTPFHRESTIALRICDEARRQTGIRFPSDEVTP